LTLNHWQIMQHIEEYLMRFSGVLIVPDVVPQGFESTWCGSPGFWEYLMRFSRVLRVLDVV